MLTAYKVYLNDGTDYVTNMAKDVTLERAQKYFVGQWFVEETDGGQEIARQAIKVETVKGVA